MKISSAIYQLQVQIICFVLILNPFAFSIANANSAKALPATQNNSEFVDYLSSEQERLEATFDKDELILNLDFDTDKIINFMTIDIAYQAYDGVLRGMKGTLIGRSGNSHDQAITLASLLKDAGLEAQTIVATLTDDQVKELNSTIASAKLAKLKSANELKQPAILKQYQTKIDELLKKNEKELATTKKETEELSKSLYNKIPKDKLQKGEQAFEKNLMNSSKSYRWVRYRMTPSDDWVEVHPAYSGAKNWNLKHQSYDKGSIDAKDVQHVSVEVFIQNSDGENHLISGDWKKPAANLLDHTLTLEFGSDAMSNPDLMGNHEELFKQSQYFYLQIDGKLQNGGKVFDLSGNIYSEDSLAGLNTIFATVGAKSQKATDALSGMGFSKETKKELGQRQLTKVWMEFTLDKPNSESKKIKRVIFEGNAKKEPSIAAMRILQRWDVDVSTTTPMQQYYQYQKVDQTLKVLNGMEKLHKYIDRNPTATQQELMQKYVDAAGNPNVGTLIHKRVAFDSLGTNENTINYVSEPNLLAVRQGLAKKDNQWSIYEMTDILSNQSWSFEKEASSSLKLKTIESIKQGIWQTRVESTRLTDMQNTIYHDSAYSKLAQVGKLGKQNAMASNELQISNQSNSAWWQIDVESGSTIGMADLGYGVGGSEVTNEMLLNYIALGISGAFFVAGTAACVSGGGDVTCCVGVNGNLLLAGLMLGFVLGAVTILSGVVGSAIGIGFDFAATRLPNLCK